MAELAVLTMALNKQECLAAAEEMIERFGSDAILQIDQRIKELVELQETDAAQFWRDVRTAVVAIQQDGGSRFSH